MLKFPPRYRIANLQKWRTPGSQSIFELSTFGLISVINHLAQQPCIQTVLDTTIVLLQVQAGVALNTAASERTRHTKKLKNATVEIPPRYRIANLQKWRTPCSQSIFELSSHAVEGAEASKALQPCSVMHLSDVLCSCPSNNW